MHLDSDSRIVMTFDAGGTNVRFSAMRGGKPVAEMVALPSNGSDLPQCLANLIEGFTRVKALMRLPSSISVDLEHRFHWRKNRSSKWLSLLITSGLLFRRAAHLRP